jgi:hypothetical protein
MEMRLLRLVHSYIVADTTGLGAERLEQILGLLELTWDLQSEPAEKASEVLARLRALDDAWLNQVEQELKADPTFMPEKLLLFSYLATFKWLLQDESYSIILDAYPVLAGEMRRVAAWIDQIPFTETVQHVESNWDYVRSRSALELAAMTHLRACGRIEVFAGRTTYERVASRLTFKAGFLLVLVAASCFKVPAIASRVDIGQWEDSQYACMRILDHFADLGETAWG